MKNIGFSLSDSRSLVDCAMGRTSADLVIRKGTWVCVQTGELIPDIDIAVADQRIAYVGPDASHTIDTETKIIEADGKYLVPGLMDGHMHVESGMLTVTEFVRAVLPHGTTGMFVDPHEIANVFGLQGVRLMVDEASEQPIHVFVQVPSCVPSAPGLETSGGVLGPEEVAEALTWPGVIGLGEVMNYPGVIFNDEKMHGELQAAREAKKVIGGHYPTPDLGIPFHGYAAGGAQDDHEGTRWEDAVARARQGMWVMMRYGSAWHDVAAQIKAVTEHGLSPRHFILCTDDSHSETLLSEGHMDRVVRRAISQGVSPVTAIQMATINTAEHFGVDSDMGMIAPGRYADILLVPDLDDFQVETVIAKGEVASEEGILSIELPDYDHPEWATSSVKFPRSVTAKDFVLDGKGKQKAVANVIGVIENQAPTRHLRVEVPVQDGEIKADLGQDLAKIAVLERHHNTGRIQVALVQGFGFDSACAVASTVAHDCHQMIVVGTDDENMAIAANELAALGGGQLVVKDGKVVGSVKLPIAGLMSNAPAQTVARDVATVLDGIRECGCSLNNPNMQMSLLGLVVIPDLRLSDLGLVDVNKFDFIPIIED